MHFIIKVTRNKTAFDNVKTAIPGSDNRYRRKIFFHKSPRLTRICTLLISAIERHIIYVVGAHHNYYLIYLIHKFIHHFKLPSRSLYKKIPF